MGWPAPDGIISAKLVVLIRNQQEPYVKRNKNDGRDAEEVCEAMARPTTRFVPVKSRDNQAVQVMHRTRRLPVRQRTMSAIALRSALADHVLPQGQRSMHRAQRPDT
jgi:transposase